MPSSCDHQHQPTSSTLVIRELHRTLDQVEKLAALIARDVHCNKFYEEEEEEEKEDFVVVVVVNVVERGQSLRRRKIFVKTASLRYRKKQKKEKEKEKKKYKKRRRKPGEENEPKTVQLLWRMQNGGWLIARVFVWCDLSS
uniref:Uncharacterized protein n=1 Tax=Vespula pensylvanica TaxID=30213 RepID=A0A834UDB8_VESPE|nr:hypothetical protein H0235_004806 [Vespula pensylvanica]